MKQTPVLTIPDEAKAALKPTKFIPARHHPAIRKAASMHFRELVFGERMRPSFKEQLLHFSSFRALMSGRPT